MLTIEGQSQGTPTGEQLDPVQLAFLENGGRSGLCTPGFVLTAKVHLDINPEPSFADHPVGALHSFWALIPTNCY